MKKTILLAKKLKKQITIANEIFGNWTMAKMKDVFDLTNEDVKSMYKSNNMFTRATQIFLANEKGKQEEFFEVELG